jgi:hypothetical protein
MNWWKSGVVRVIIYAVTVKTEPRRVVVLSKNEAAPGSVSFFFSGNS